MVDEAVIVEAARRLCQAAPDARVFLFGSHARGEANRHSDLDLLVIEPDVENAAKESVRLMRVLRHLRAPVEVIVVSQRHVDEWRHVRGSLVHAALAEARELAA